MKISKEVVKKNAIADLTARMVHLENIVLRLRGEQVVLNRIAESLPKDRDSQRSSIAKLIDSSASKVNELSREITNQVTDGRRSIGALK